MATIFHKDTNLPGYANHGVLYKQLLLSLKVKTSNRYLTGVLEWIFHNSNDIQNKKTEEQDQKSLSSVSVPRTGLFCEPFLHDLDLIWQVDAHIDGSEKVGFGYA